MGSGSSVEMVGTDADIVERMLPIYYVRDALVTEEDIEYARKSWKMIIDDSSPVYLELKANNAENVPNSCLTWFYDSFYERSYSLDSSSRTLYKDNLKIQVKALTGMINLCLNMFKDRTKTDTTLTAVANGHSKKGVKAFQYGIVGEVLLWTFDKCLGTSNCALTKAAWVRIFSYSLKVILPVAVANDRKEDVASLPTIRQSEAAKVDQESRRQVNIEPTVSSVALPTLPSTVESSEDIVKPAEATEDKHTAIVSEASV